MVSKKKKSKVNKKSQRNIDFLKSLQKFAKETRSGIIIINDIKL